MLPSGSGVGRPQTQGPKWHHKRYAGSPSPPGWATERVSPLSASPRDTHSTGRSSSGAMCHRLACASQRHRHININKHAYVGMCEHPPGPSPAPSHLHVALAARHINAFIYFLQSDIFIIQLSNEQLKHEFWRHGCRRAKQLVDLCIGAEICHFSFVHEVMESG